MFRANILKISEILNRRNLLKICVKFTYPTDFCIICNYFTMEKKMKIFDFLKQMTKIKLFVYIYIVTTNGFTLNHNK